MLYLSIITVFGISMILVESYLFSTIRNLLYQFNFTKNLISCMLCTGVWVGFMFSFYYNPFTVTNNILDNVVCGIFFGTTTWFIHILESYVTRI